jgi:poly-gamma-glutamate capsule biosynthesis protein CapA/YwtB (metallophosphatase superfamily)
MREADSTATPLETPTLVSVTFSVPLRWAEAASQAVDIANQEGSRYSWELIVQDESGQPEPANLILVRGGAGIPAGRRPLAFAVPVDSEWYAISSEEAREVIERGSPFISLLDWADIPVTMRALWVDGTHPSQPEYPLHEEWSVTSQAAYQGAGAQIAEVIRPLIEKDDVTLLAAVGDIMLDRALGERIRSGEIAYPFAAVSQILAAADIATGNLESSLGNSGSPEKKGYTFRAPPEAAETLASGGFDVISIANNHAADYGRAALLEAIELLGEAGIPAVGAGINEAAARSPVLVRVNGRTAAFLAYVDVPVEYRGFDARTWTAGDTRPGVAWADPAKMETDIRSAMEVADWVIVILHSGYEYVEQPSPVQVRAAKSAMDAGASLVIGHHSHVLQPVEYYGQGIIIYGLGNFAFEDAGPPESAILLAWLDAGGLRQIDLIPIVIEPDGRPRPAEGDERLSYEQKFADLFRFNPASAP